MKARTFAEVGLALVAVYVLAQAITPVVSVLWVVGAGVIHFSGFRDFLGILLVLLTVVAGLLTQDGQQIDLVPKVDQEILRLARSGRSALGSGGMVGKLDV